MKEDAMNEIVSKISKRNEKTNSICITEDEYAKLYQIMTQIQKITGTTKRIRIGTIVTSLADNYGDDFVQKFKENYEKTEKRF